MLPRSLLTILLFALAAGSSWWLYQQIKPTEPSQQIQASHDPDYFIEDFVVRSMNAKGQIKHRLKGIRMMHFPDDDSAELESPELELYVDAVPTWKINAERGLIFSGGDQVKLLGEVRMKRHAEREQDVIYAQTRDVLVKPDEEYAETEQLVTITSGNGGLTVRAVGMRAYIDQGRVELLSNVEGVHVP